MTDDELTRLEALAKAATPGPWLTTDTCSDYVFTVLRRRSAAMAPDVNMSSEEDAAFIASAREAVPALIAEVRRLRAEKDIAAHREEVASRLLKGWQETMGDDPHGAFKAHLAITDEVRRLREALDLAQWGSSRGCPGCGGANPDVWAGSLRRGVGHRPECPVALALGRPSAP